jgi:hypothetical protein
MEHMEPYASVTTDDGWTVESNSASEEAIRENFDADVTVESSADDTPVEDTPSRSRDAAGKFAKAVPAEPAKATKDEAKPEWEAENRRPTNAEARKSPQARIAQQTWDKRETERRAEAAERRAEEAERRAAERDRELQTLRQPRQEAQPRQPAPERFPPLTEWVQRHPNGSLDDYMDARDAWRDDQSVKRVQAEARNRALAEQAQTFGARLQQAKATDPEIGRKLAPELVAAVPISGLPPGARPSFANLVAEIGLSSENPAALFLHLSANNSAEAHRITRHLHPSLWERELTRLDGRLSSASQRTHALPSSDSSDSPAAHSGSAMNRVPSKAAPPIKPVGSSPNVADDDGSDDESVEMFIRRENARDRKAGRL